MDILDTYKNVWDNQTENDIVSKSEIFKMTQANSSSIVKWIYIIGLAEILLSVFVLFFSDSQKTLEIVSEAGVKNLFIGIQVLCIPIVAFFLFKFYKNWKNISVAENTKELMQNILKTRRSVKLYVLFNLILMGIVSLAIGIPTFLNPDSQLSNQEVTIGIITTILFTLLLIGGVWSVYQLLYGILLKKLKTNYKELTNLDE